MGDALSWSGWEILAEKSTFQPPGFRETLLGGQAFRWREAEPEVYEGIWENHWVQFRCSEAGEVRFRHPRESPVSLEIARHYLGFHLPWNDLADQLPHRSDQALRRAMQPFPGLRILQQPPGETLLSFLCSSNKQIVQIRQIHDALAQNLGKALWPGAPVHRLPTWVELSEAKEADLLNCRLGYRAKLVAGTASSLAENPGFLESIQEMTTEEARMALQELPGVGPKVADCILLFGYHRLEAFPIDTWILKILETAYGLTGWSRKQLEQFVKAHFGDLGGLAQQYLFAHARAEGKKGRDA